MRAQLPRATGLDLGSDLSFSWVYVRALLPGGAAELSGLIEPGDQIVAINEQSMLGVPFDKVVDSFGLNNEDTGIVTLDVFRGERDELLDAAGIPKDVLGESAPTLVVDRNYAGNAKTESLTIDAIDVGANLRDVLVENDVNVYQNVARFVNCNGKQLCGTCIVEVKDGMKYTNRKTVDEDGTLTLQKCPKNYRLACVTYVYGNVTVATIPPREGGYFGSSSSGSAW